ncbi:MAG: hypothetical protein DRN19_02825 [Thermoplasmata archaeon]|nr:MAG: hypothetical protein DRN19_02825 [Thermoplasmata archaeon]
MGRKKSIEDLNRRLDILAMKSKPHIMKRLCKIEVFNEFNLWTPLKLIALSYFVGPFLRIVGNLKEIYGNLFIAYIDVFAGSGINKFGDYYTVGSPIAAIDSANTTDHKFDMMYFADKNEEFIEALCRRLELLEKYEEYRWITDRYKVIHGEANETLPAIVEEISENRYKNCLAFIDPYKWEIKMDVLSRLLEEIRGDVLITHQAVLTAKEIGKFKKGMLKDDTANKIAEYLGVSTSDLPKFDTEEKVKNLYVEKIKEYKSYVKAWTVRSDTGYRYHLIFASSKKDPSWAGVIESLTEFEKFTGNLVKYCFDRMAGRAPRITDF